MESDDTVLAMCCSMGSVCMALVFVAVLLLVASKSAGWNPSPAQTVEVAAQLGATGKVATSLQVQQIVGSAARENAAQIAKRIATAQVTGLVTADFNAAVNQLNQQQRTKAVATLSGLPNTTDGNKAFRAAAAAFKNKLPVAAPAPAAVQSRAYTEFPRVTLMGSKLAMQAMTDPAACKKLCDSTPKCDWAELHTASGPSTCVLKSAELPAECQDQSAKRCADGLLDGVTFYNPKRADGLGLTDDGIKALVTTLQAYEDENKCEGACKASKVFNIIGIVLGALTIVPIGGVLGLAPAPADRPPWCP